MSLSSSTSSSSSTTSGQGQYERDKSTVQPPRNLSRLGRTFSDINTTSTSTPKLGSSEFKVPSLPRHQHPSYHQSSDTQSGKTEGGRRPLTMIDEPNIPPASSSSSSFNALDETTPTPTSTPNRLKRLSLVDRRPAGLLDPPHISPRIKDDTSPTPRTASTPAYAHAGARAGAHRTISNLSTPRGTRMRGSISYSPSSASASPYRPNPLSPKLPEYGFGVGRSSWDMERGGSSGGGGGRGSMDEHQHPKGETWSDRHADLLQSIAQKQRRINELKQELQAEQSALYSLKQRWTELVSSTFSSPPPPDAKISSLPIHDIPFMSTTTPSSSSHPNDMATSPSTSSRAFSDNTTDDNRDKDPPGFSSLLDEVLGNAPLVDPSVVEGGKRFIGNLMRTVGAAAGGNVPEDNGVKENAGIGGMDISGLRGIFSWNSTSNSNPTPRTNTVKIRPADTATRSSQHTPSPPSDLMD